MSITAFAIAASQNTGGKKDASHVFLPGAQKFARAYNCGWRQFDNTGSNTSVRGRVFDIIRDQCPAGLNFFAYFGHGISTGMSSADIFNSNIDDFLKVLLPKVAKPFVMALYACSAGIEGGFTGKLRERLGGQVWVYGHTTAGHSFKNPDVSEEASGNTPSYRRMYPYGTQLRGAWSEALKWTDLWLRFPFMEDPAIEAEVNARRLLGVWEVNISGALKHYQFDMKVETWTINSGKDIEEPPTGKVKVMDPKKHKTILDEGVWTITDRVHIKWVSGATESWLIPLVTTGQPVMSGGITFSAKRLSHPEDYGILQG